MSTTTDPYATVAVGDPNPRTHGDEDAGMCPARTVVGRAVVYCTLDPGHGPTHVAEGFEIVRAVWHD